MSFPHIDYTQIVKDLLTNYPEECEAAIATSDDAVHQRFLFNQRWDMEKTNVHEVFEEDIDFMHQPGDDPEWIFAFNRLKHFISLGQAYHLTGREEYARTFAKQCVHWINSVPEDEKHEKAWRTIETGIRLDTLTRSYLLFRDSEAFKEIEPIFMKSIEAHAASILKRSWNSYHLMSNWGVLSNHGLYMASVVFDRPEWEKEALYRLSKELENEVYDDGVQWEQSPMYHNEVLRDFLDIVFFSQFGSIELEEWFKEKVHKMALANLAWMKPNGTEPMMGDSDDIDMRDLITESALIFKDPNLKSIGYEELDFETSWVAGSDGINAYRAIVSEKPAKTGYFLHSSGNCIDRSAWEEDADYLRFHCGTLGAGHGHADQTHFSFVCKGKDFLVDAGRFTYVPGERRYMFKNNYAHNVAVVDKHSLYPEKDSWECYSLDRAVNTRSSFKGDYTTFEGGHLGYYRDGVFVNRRVIWLKEAELLIAVDEFYAKGKHSYESLFHFAEGIKSESVSVKAFSASPLEISSRSSFISRHYNRRSENEALVVSAENEGFTSIWTLFDLRAENSLEAGLVEVKSNFKGITFRPDQIEALEIKGKDRHFVVAVAHEEYATPTDTFLAAGCTGFGNLTIFDKNKGETEIGTRMFC